MKKILVFIDWYLPGYKAGGPIRSMANMISNLKEEYCFYVVCRNTDYLENIPYKNIKPGEWNQLSDNENVYYIDNSSLSSKSLKRIIKSENFDLVYINGVYSYYFSILPLILSKKLRFKKIIVAPRGMLSNQAFSSKKLKKAVFIKLAKILGHFKNIVFHVTSPTEEKDIQLLNLKPKDIQQIANLSPFVLKNEATEIEKKSGELKLVSIARVSPEKNTLFALECLSQGFKGRIYFSIYGSVYNKEYWKQCLETISCLPENIEVVYKGEINNNEVISILHQNHFLFLPSKGENFGHSILESFIAGRPVIISNKTPWLNLQDKKLGWDIDLNKEFFAQAIQEAVMLNNQEYQMITESCKDYAIKLTDNSRLKEGYRILFG
jgi:glycosyltransferase involved in cell wall biosynthesis